MSAENPAVAALNGWTETIIGAAMRVHSMLGPGLLESAYEACLVHELASRNIRVERQVALPVTYEGVRLDCGYRIDLLVERLVIVELKATERTERIHRQQLLSYLRLARLRVGLLINFNVPSLRDGISRVVNQL